MIHPTHRATLLGLALAAHLLVACGESPPSSPDLGPSLPDSGVTFNVDPGGEGHKEVGSTLAGGEVRAGKVTAASQLLPGIKVQGRVGDFKLYNSKVAFIIQTKRPSDGFGPYGGEILDAAWVGRQGEEGQSLLGEVLLSAGMYLAGPSSVGVVEDGSNRTQAMVRVIAEPARFPYLGAVLGDQFGSKPSARMVIDYLLRPDSEVLEIRWRFFNQKDTEEKISLPLLFLTAGDGAPLYSEGAGFDTEIPVAGDYVALIAPWIGYVIHSPDKGMTSLPLSSSLTALLGGSFSLPASGEAQRRFLLALADGEPEAVRRKVRELRKQGEPTPVSGQVVEGARGPVAGARVHVETDEPSPTYVTMSRSAADGKYRVALDPGTYRFTAVADGRLPGEVKVVKVGQTPLIQDLTLEGTSTVRYTVTDETGAPLPAKLSVVRAEGLPVIPPSFGEVVFPSATSKDVTTRHLFSADGKGEVKLPPGTVSLVASRGFEYETDTRTMTLVAGETVDASFKLRRSVDTTGYMCGDFHVHAMWSADSDDTFELKAAALAASGVEIPALTEHDFVVDLNPTVAKLGLQKWLRVIVGEEVSDPQSGHFNPLSIAPDPSRWNGGAVPWYDMDVVQQMAAIRAAWPEAVLQLNHPRYQPDNPSNGANNYLTYVKYDPVTGKAEKAALWSRNFDVIELFNASGWVPNVYHTLPDWFSFLDRGFLVTATGNSDSHVAQVQAVGFPRNYVKLSTDEPANLNLQEFIQAMKHQRVVVSGGPFVTVEVAGKGLGEVARATGGKAQVSVKVQGPTWMSIDTLKLFVGGKEVKTVPLDGSTADPNNPVVRYQGSLEVTATRDTWVVVAVTGSRTLFPVSADFTPFALTNPVYLDVDGNGTYDPPSSF